MSPAAPSGSTSPRGDRRREDILSALDERLKTTALDDISVADLTEAAGITRSAFYFYFDSKAAAVSMLLVVVNKEAGEAIDIIVGGEGDFRRRVTAGLTRLIDRVLEVDHIYRALLTARTKHEPTREMWDAGRRYNAAPVADFIRAERAAGRAPEGADAQSLAEACCSSTSRSSSASSTSRRRPAIRSWPSPRTCGVAPATAVSTRPSTPPARRMPP